MVLPIAPLLALLYALTHHDARHHELTALRAAGVGRGGAPYFVVGWPLAGGITLR